MLLLRSSTSFFPKATLSTFPELGAVIDARDTAENTSENSLVLLELNIPLRGREKQTVNEVNRMP